MTPLFFALPWLGLLGFVVFVARFPRPLAMWDGDAGAPAGSGQPSVSVIVPARNEAVGIVECVSSLAALDYPDFEIIVVDDRSSDGTAALARSVPAGNARALIVVDGEDLPPGWLGKPWACMQGARRASGSLLLFTDADTRHEPGLLARAVVGMEEEDADLLTLVGRQLMETFWERLVQPHVFLMMLTRFPDFERVAKNDRWRDAIANGQYLLFRRSSYEAIGGHEAVRDEVVEDLALAQHVKRAGLKLRLRSAEDAFATRMYRSLAHLVEGWSKNIVMGGLQSFPRWIRPVVAPISSIGIVVIGLAAPLALLGSTLAWIGGRAVEGGVFGSAGGSIAGGAGGVASAVPDVLAWAIAVYALSAMTFGWFSRRMGAGARYGLIYPLGSAVVWFIFMRSWLQGRRVVWKGRTYRLKPASERP